MVKLFKLLSSSSTKRLSVQSRPAYRELDHTYPATSSVSIIIPTRDRVELLAKCIESILVNTTSVAYEIVVVDNDSVSVEATEYFKTLRIMGVQVIRHPGKFNFSEICNFASSQVSTEYLCFLNNDTEVISTSWLQSMLLHAREPGVGLVGSKLFYPDGSIQHVGIATGVYRLAFHPFDGMSVSTPNYQPIKEKCYEVTGVTFAAALIRKSIFDSQGGLETKFRVGFNDVDFGLRLNKSGFVNVVCTHSKLLHLTSESRRAMPVLESWLMILLANLRLWVRHRGAINKGDDYFHL